MTEFFYIVAALPGDFKSSHVSNNAEKVWNLCK